MPQPFSFDHLQAILRQYTTDLPDVRKPSPNTRDTRQNAALEAFGIFFCKRRRFWSTNASSTTVRAMIMRRRSLASSQSHATIKSARSSIRLPLTIH
jgi:hypothetical protein